MIWMNALDGLLKLNIVLEKPLLGFSTTHFCQQRFKDNVEEGEENICFLNWTKQLVNIIAICLLFVVYPWKEEVA